MLQQITISTPLISNEGALLRRMSINSEGIFFIFSVNRDNYIRTDLEPYGRNPSRYI